MSLTGQRGNKRNLRHAPFWESAKRIVQSLNRLIHQQGKPQAIRLDNGPEFISEALEVWAEKHHIQPGKPTQNPFIERFS